MAETEPPFKRVKLEDSTEINTLINSLMNSTEYLQAVISDEYHKPVSLTKVYVGHVANPKELSKLIQVLNEKIPLKELQHLKRVFKRKVLLCPTFYLNNSTQETIQDFLEQYVTEFKDSFEYFSQIDVPTHMPKTKSQYKETNRTWSCNFHPDNRIEQLVSNRMFTEQETLTHRLYMGIAFQSLAWQMLNNEGTTNFVDTDTNVAVVVDPKFRSVVSVAIDNRKCHPTQHSAMLAIDNVARTQGGGSWPEEKGRKWGIDTNLVTYLQDKLRQTFGPIPCLKGTPDEPYLCTGYSVYMIREPCLMCAMALVHARVKRVFFCHSNPKQGALMSKVKLQCIKSLNHHFEVYTGFL